MRAIFRSACAAIGLSTLTLAIVASAGPAVGGNDAPDAAAPDTDAARADDAGSATTPASSAPELADAAAPDAGHTPSDVGFSAGVRASFALPFGAAKSVSLSDVITRAIPLGIEAGYFLDRRLYVGVYVLYGFGTNGNASATCSDPNISCSASQWRFGGMAQWHFLPGRTFSPWAGGALGYDIVNLTSADSTGADSPAGSLHGFELSLLAGLDYKPLTYLGVGPFAELSMGHYAGATSATALYEWLALGVRFRTGL